MAQPGDQQRGRGRGKGCSAPATRQERGWPPRRGGHPLGLSVCGAYCATFRSLFAVPDEGFLMASGVAPPVSAAAVSAGVADGLAAR